MEQELKFKHKNTFRNLLSILIGIILLLVGLVGYFWTKSQAFFYITVGANVFIVYGFIASQVRKNMVVHDLVFVKYRLKKEAVQRLKFQEIDTISREDDTLVVNFNDAETRRINLEDYAETSITEFEELLRDLTVQNRISS